MSSDGYFEGDDLDDAAFDELDVIEAAALKSPPRPSSVPTSGSTAENDSFYDLTLELDENDLRKLDDFENDAYNGKAIAGPSLSRTGLTTHQTTLFGGVLSPSSTAPRRSQMQRTKSVLCNSFEKQAQKIKVWDQTAFAKSGLKSGKLRGKGKASCDFDEQEEEAVEFEQFPAPFVSAVFRARDMLWIWKEKRVFYMTPQTLVNDLKTETCDVRDIVLLVIDEAHRATGGYAYNQIVQFLMAKNPHFRVLALTATPGGNPDAVQNLIDGLHISHIEIRDENSLDLKPFLNHKRIEQHIITMTEDVNKVKEPLATLMDKEQRWAYSPLSRLASLARAMGYLFKIEGTMGMCYTYLQDLSRADDEEAMASKGRAAAASRKKNLREDPMFQAVLRELDNQKARGFSVHPKMDRLKTLIIQHFAQQLPDEDDTTHDETRVMVFVTFREAVDEIVDALNFERPLIRAHKFIGQGTDKQARYLHTLTKLSFQVIQRFKAGEFNVLVATSIGEEGLDIGEVDLIVCYDAQKTPILQRLGRTGRKRAGVVHVLLAEGREELNLEKAKDTYKEVQKTILRGEQLEFYTDVPRLLPDHIKPECLQKAMEIQEYIRNEGKKQSAKENRSPVSGTKRKRNDDISRNIPAGANTGFVSVADLLIKPKKQKKLNLQVQRKDFDNAGEDDDTDMDIESGIVNAAPLRAKSFVPSSSNHFDQTSLRKAKTTIPRKTRGIKQKKRTELSSQLDVDIERGLVISPSCGDPKPSLNKHGKRPSSPSPASTITAVIDLIDPEDQDFLIKQWPHYLPFLEVAVPESAENIVENVDESMAWLIDGDEDQNLDFEVVDSSPILSRITKAKTTIADDHHRDPDMDRPCELKSDDGDDLIKSVDSSITQNYQPSSPLWPASSSPVKPIMVRKRSDSREKIPPLLQRPLLGSPDGLQIPEPSFPVRALAQTKRRTFPGSPNVLISSPVPRRLHRRRYPKLDKNESRKVHTSVDVRADPVFDIEAEHSGDEISAGSSDPEDEESEEDRRFLEELPETQVSPSYDQTLAYRQSLLTQAPRGAKVPAFANAPRKRGLFSVGSSTRRRPPISSSPPRENEGADEYILDSFVVDDDAEISYLSDE
ncbi:ATP-dependent DNA helicase MPH1 [Termitomyces sp. J132]|nr:ATP-dependent DNA helicase MPH1 [Termitomyces sp. J132]